MRRNRRPQSGVRAGPLQAIGGDRAHGFRICYLLRDAFTDKEEDARRIAILTNEYPPHIYGDAGVHVHVLIR